MNQETKSEIAQQAVAAIIDDLCDRRGLKQVWDDIDEDTQTEIRTEWERMVMEAISTKQCTECDRPFDDGGGFCDCGRFEHGTQ